MKLEEMLNYPRGTMFHRKSWEFENLVFYFNPTKNDDPIICQMGINGDVFNNSTADISASDLIADDYEVFTKPLENQIVVDKEEEQTITKKRRKRTAAN